MVDTEMLKSSSRSEWPAMLHNLCFIHGAIRLRSRYHRAGFNIPQDLFPVGTQELLVSRQARVSRHINLIPVH